MSAERPYVTAHTAVSLDGATTGFPVDTACYYRLAATFGEDVTLTGADTILAQEAALTGAAGPGPARDGPLLAVVDSRRRVRRWAELRAAGHWSDVLALRAAPSADPPVAELATGGERVDLGAALAELGRRGARRVRVDSGGALTGALLRAGLLDEISLLVHPHWAGGDGRRRWYGAAAGPPAGLRLVANRSVGDGLVWLCYRTGG
jgi:2,5-diamino-6-(ribosylamino)-4(3H)-pyrimidinone 5'-phosphate reductase